MISRAWKIYLCGTALAAFASIAQGAATIQVIFVNGIHNYRQDAVMSAARIQDILDTSANHLMPKRDYHVVYIYNPAGFTSDGPPPSCLSLWDYGCDGAILRQELMELFIQKTAEEHFLADFQKILAPHNSSSVIDQAAALRIKNGYVDNLLPGGNSLESSGAVTSALMAPNGTVIANIINTVKSNSQSIVVAHSQGNLLVNLAYAALASEFGQGARKMIRVVNVANTSRFAVSGLNISHANDAGLFSSATRYPPGDRSLETLPSQGVNWTRTTDTCTNAACNFLLSAATFEGVSTPGDLDHMFVESYLSEVDLPPHTTVQQGVPLTPNKTRFVDRFEDFVYAAAYSLDIENGPKTPIAVFDNLGDRRFCSVTGSLSCPGSAFIGVEHFLNSQLAKAALAVSIPTGPAVDLTSIELPVYYSAGSNQITISVRQDAAGLPYPFAVVTSRTLTGSMKFFFSFFVDPTPTTLLVSFDPGAVVLQGGSRYWIEVSAPAPDTSAIWTFGRIPMFGNQAQSFNGRPYALTGDQEPAMRVVVTPH